MPPRRIRIGFLTVEDYRRMPGPGSGEHSCCESERHDGQGIPAVAVIVVSAGNGIGLVWGACQDCYAAIDDEIGAQMHYLGAPG